MLLVGCLVIGIIGFVKGRVSVTKTKELRGKPLYLVCALMCVPIPLTFVVAFIMVAMSGSSGNEVSDATIRTIDLVCGWGPILTALLIAFAMARPKQPVAAAEARGFEVQPPAPPPTN